MPVEALERKVPGQELMAEKTLSVTLNNINSGSQVPASSYLILRKITK